MGREVNYGIKVTAKNEAGAALRTVGAEGEKMGEGVKDGAEKGRRGLESLSLGLSGLNAGLSLAKKAWHALSSTFDMFVESSMKQRAEGDSQRKAIEATKIQIERITGLIGDLLLPVITGVSDAMKPVLDASERYLKDNREMLGSGVIEWFQKIATVLVRGVAGAVMAVTAAWYGWQEAIGAVTSLAASGFSAILDGVNLVLDGARNMAIAFGKDDMVKSIMDAQRAIRGLSKDSQDTADTQLASAARAVNAQEKVQAAILQVEQALEQGIGQAGVRAHERLSQAIKKVPPNYDEWLKKVAELEAAHARLASKIEAAISADVRMITREWEQAANAGDAALKRLEEDAKRQEDAQKIIDEETKARTKTLEADMQAVAQNLIALSTTAFADLGKKVEGHTKTWGDAFKQLGAGIGKMILDQAAAYVTAKGIEMGAEKISALFTIKAAAAKGGAEGVAAHASIPFVGLAIGAVAAAAIVAAIMAFAGKMQSGGIVNPTGAYGDRHLFALGRGEMVIPEKATPHVLNMLNAGLAPAGAGGGGGSMTLNLNASIHSFAAVDRASAQRDMEKGGVLDIINDWLKTGKIRLPAGK